MPNQLSNYLYIAGAMLLAIFFVLTAFISSGVISADARGIDEIEFPILQLGGCENESACAQYCEDPNHILACIDFGEENDLMSQSEADRARTLLSIDVIEGPGGCSSEEECELYCENISNIRECVAFAREHGMMDDGDIEEAEAIIVALDAGVELPGGCTDKDSCELYCKDDAHIQECVEFAEVAGFISPEEAEIARKTGGKGPGGCSMDECELYCEDPANMRVCMEFAIEHEIMPEHELDEMRGMLRAIESGATPPPCGGKDECDEYCSQPEHAAECIDFAVAAGMMDEEDAKHAMTMMEKGIFGGPGGCQGEEECSAYCEDPKNQDECMMFAVDAGFMSEEEFGEMKHMMEGGDFDGRHEMRGPGGCEGKEECEAYCSVEENIDECMRFGGNRIMDQSLEIIMQDFEREEFEHFMRELENMPEEFRSDIDKRMPENLPEEHKDIIHGDFRDEHFDDFEYIKDGSDYREQDFEKMKQRMEYGEFDSAGVRHEYRTHDAQGFVEYHNTAGIPDEFVGEVHEEFLDDFYEEFDREDIMKFKEQYETHLEQQIEHEVMRQIEEEVKKEFEIQFNEIREYIPEDFMHHDAAGNIMQQFDSAALPPMAPVDIEHYREPELPKDEHMMYEEPVSISFKNSLGLVFASLEEFFAR